MKMLLVYLSVLVACLALVVVARVSFASKLCWCWSGSQHMVAGPKPQIEKNEYVSFGSYGSEVDWNNPERIIPLDYNQDQGKRIYYQQCVWCHSDSTPAGPSNRSNVSPDPPLMNDGSILNAQSDASLKKIISQGGSAAGKSSMMPPYGSTLSEEEINEVIAYIRVIAVPEYKSGDKSETSPRSKPL
jgi:cytochrome c oxidase cbb3-type subunit III